MKDSEQRDRFHEGLYYPNAGEALERQEATFKAVVGAEQVVKKVKKAIRAKKIPRIKGDMKLMAEKALDANIITQEEFDLVVEAEKLRWEAIQVDDFDNNEYGVVKY